MITLPTPIFLVLLLLALPTVCGVFAIISVLFMLARIEHVEKQQARRAHAQLFRSIDEYLQKVGSD